MLEVNNLFHATRIIEGYGVIETTGQECANLGFGKVLVITDPFLASSEHYKKLKKSLDDAKIENFLLTNVKPNQERKIVTKWQSLRKRIMLMH